METKLRQNPLPDVPLVSIVILNYNGKSFLKRCVQSVLQGDYERLEIIVVDNGSSDGGISCIQDLCGSPKLKTVCLNKNLGFSKGNNIGASYALGKYIVFLNNDTEVTSSWLTELVAVMEKNPQVGAAQPKLLFVDNGEVQSAGNYIDTMGFAIQRVRLSEEQRRFNDQSEIAATGAAFIIRRSLFNSIHGFEPNFFVYYEDNDLSWRVYLAGKSILYVPSSIVFHTEGAGFSRLKLAFRANNYVKNQLFTVFKNYSFKNGLSRIALLYLFYATGAILLAAKKNRELYISILKALYQFPKIFKECWKSHLFVQRGRKVDDKELTKHFLKPFDPYRLFKFYRNGMGYVSVDYSRTFAEQEQNQKRPNFKYQT